MRPEPWQTLSDGSILTRQEQFVLRQVAKGEIADLKQEFGAAEEDRRLRARFLEELLTGELNGVKIHRRGVQIKNAVVEDGLGLENGEVSADVGLNSFIFKESVSFRDAYFKDDLSIGGSHFLKEANFHRLKVDGGIFCRNTVFSGPVSFANATITGTFSAERSEFLAKDYEIDFNAMHVGQSAGFNGTEFHGGVNFSGVDIKGQFLAQGANFHSEYHEIHFNSIQVGLDARVDGAEFHGSVDFVGAEIKRQFVAVGAKFLASDHKANFHRMQVGQDAHFQDCDFHGVVSFVLIKVAGDFHLEPLLKSGPYIATIFRSDINLRGADIGGEFIADLALFLGHSWVNFNEMQVGRNFSATGAVFAGPVNFSAMQVKNNFYIDPFGRMKSFKTLFKGAANFSDVEVHGVFNADQAIFQSESTIFSGLKVGKGAFFNGTIFFGGLVLKEGQLTDLVIRGLHRLSKGGLPLTEIVLNRTRITHRLTIEDVEVKRFEARNLEVKGPAEFSRVFIRAEADFRDAACHHIQMVEVDWPEPRDGKGKVFLDGLTYESITTRKEPDKPEDWPKLLAWQGLSRFNTKNYQELDGFFQRGGLRKWADKVHMAGKRRELGKRKWWNPANWLIRLFWGLLAGYGRKPGRVFWVSLGIILLGALMLDPRQMLAPDLLQTLRLSPDDLLQSIALRGILSLYGFLSAIPGWSGHLQIQTPDFFTFMFLWLQRLCGWILIPIGLAALYTRLK